MDSRLAGKITGRVSGFGPEAMTWTVTLTMRNRLECIVKNKVVNDQSLNQSTIRRSVRGASAVPIGVLVLMLVAAPGLIAQSIGVPFLPGPIQIVSTIPANGDLNPYGVAFVPPNFPSGHLNPGDILVSNFNNSQNLQGTGTTIIRVTPQAQPSLFFTARSGQQGLSTALGILQEGLIIVGNFPSTNGTCSTAGNGNLLVINSAGQQVQTITDENYINGPWDMALYDLGGGRVDIFITNGLSGDVTRLNTMISGGTLTVQSKTTIASGYMHQCDPVTFVDAPTGLVYNQVTDTLYVASTVDNAVFAVARASTRTDDDGKGEVVYRDQTHLHGALGLAAVPNGHLLVSNNDAINPDPNQPSEIVEFTITDRYVKELSVDPNPGGAFGLNVQTSGETSRFAAVDDNQNTLDIWTLPTS